MKIEYNVDFNRPLLSICIPTYNRRIFLQRLLDSLLPQVVACSVPVEVFITDNASSDTTQEFCEELCTKYEFLRYSRNEKNLGPDLNISKAYIEARGRFVWVFSDDDFIRDGALHPISSLLELNHDAGLVHVSHTTDSNDIPMEIVYKLTTSQDLFSKKVGINVTFISGIIVNKQSLENEKINFSTYDGLYLIQLSWVLRCLIIGHKFIQIENKYVIAEADNSGGYRFFNVFARNLTDICNSLLGKDSIASKNIRYSSMYFLVKYTGNKKARELFVVENAIIESDYAFQDFLSYRLFYRLFFIDGYISKFMYFCYKVCCKLICKFSR